MKKLLSLAVILLLTATLSACSNGDRGPEVAATNLYVDVATGLDTNNGSQAAPFKTITKGLEAAAALASNTNVNVAAGLYNVASGETFPLFIPDHTHLIGSNSGITNIDGAGDYTVSGGEYGSEWPNPVSTTVVFAPGIEGAMSWITADGMAPTVVMADNAVVTLSENTFDFPMVGGRYPVWIINGSVATITSNTISAHVAIDAADATTRVIARNNTLDGNYTVCTGDGLPSASQLDFGTTTSPGNNIILRTGSGTAAINNWANADAPAVVNAVGNTWTPNVQGADAAGRYTPQHVPGPTAGGPNYNIQPTAGINL